MLWPSVRQWFSGFFLLRDPLPLSATTTRRMHCFRIRHPAPDPGTSDHFGSFRTSWRLPHVISIQLKALWNQGSPVREAPNFRMTLGHVCSLSWRCASKRLGYQTMWGLFPWTTYTWVCGEISHKHVSRERAIHGTEYTNIASLFLKGSDKRVYIFWLRQRRLSIITITLYKMYIFIAVFFFQLSVVLGVKTWLRRD